MKRNNKKSNGAENRFGTILSYLVSIATLIGIPVGLYGYFASQHDKRVEKSFEFYRTFRSEPFQKQWNVLISRWNGKADEVSGLLAKKDYDGLQKLVASLLADEAAASAFDHAVSFFDEFAACVDNSLCDQNVGFALLKVPASDLVGAYGSQIIFIRRTYKNEKFGYGAYRVRAFNKTIDWF